jgi:hypothetical protein
VGSACVNASLTVKKSSGVEITSIEPSSLLTTSCAHCEWMAMNSLEKLLSVLQTGENEIKIDKNIKIFHAPRKHLAKVAYPQPFDFVHNALNVCQVPRGFSLHTCASV